MDKLEALREKDPFVIDSDAQLVAKAQHELPFVETSFSELMLRYERLLYQICKRLLTRSEDAEEVVQEVMIKVFHNIGNFEGRSKFKTWLLQITRRECYTHYHKNKKHQAHADFDDLADSEEQREKLKSTDQERVEAKVRMEQILSAIDIDDRQILTLRFIAELDLNEIAEVLELRLSATKMRLYRAIERAKAVAEAQ